MLVRDAMCDKPICCTPGNNLYEAAYKMLTADCGILPVVGDMRTKRLIGVLTDRDIVCRGVACGHNPLSTRVEECMSLPVVTVPDDAPLELCWDLMRRHRVRRVVAVDDAGRCCGVVSQCDAARFGPPAHAAELLTAITRGQAEPAALWRASDGFRRAAGK